ncbi:hypothetical protein QJS66_02580 [Kocuria rhizophila]|nr:hypothetical protein QJS66_02580 [Kocuria rhizophila]
MVTVEGYEADDVLATLASRTTADDFKVLSVCPGDRTRLPDRLAGHVRRGTPGRTPLGPAAWTRAAVFRLQGSTQNCRSRRTRGGGRTT